MRRLWRLLAIPLVLLVGHLGAAAALAHPLGNFTISRYNGLSFGAETVTVESIVDMAEIPAFQAIEQIDTDKSGKVDPSEAATYQTAACSELGESLALRVAEQPVALSPAGGSVSFPPGMGGLLTLRLSCELRGALPALGAGAQVAFADQSYRDRIGWREIVVNAEGLGIEGEVASASPSDMLRNYPGDMLSAPLDQREASFRLTPGGAARPEASLATAPAPMGSEDQLAALVGIPELTLPAMLAALGIAFVWGAAHALAPGHGKTVVAAYLVGARGTVGHALFLGLTTTITHTAGVFALGLVTLFAANFIAPEQLFPWLSLISGLLVAWLGFVMLRDRLRGAFHGHDHGHGHHHGDHGHDHGHGHHQQEYGRSMLRPNAPGAGDHSHDHEHEHHHGDHGHDHEHGHGHSHLPPEKVTWRSLLALGISGGLLPCPSALVVLLGAIALGRVGFGLLLVLAFSLGLAGLLTAIGVAFVYAGRLLDRLPSRPGWTRLLPVASAALVALIGCGLALRALLDVGLLG